MQANSIRRVPYNTTSGIAQASLKTEVASGSVCDRLANYCQRAERHGRDWRCNCPVCGRHGLIVSASLTYSQVFCFHCKDAGLNDGWSEQRAVFIEAGLLDPLERPKPQTREEIEAEAAEKRTLANAIWNDSRLRPTTPENEAGKYLQSRGLAAFIGHPALRYVGVFLWGHPTIALVSRVLHLRHGLSAVQFTPLCWDEDKSTYCRNKELRRKTDGVRKGGAVWINNPKPDEELVVAEGLETCLSAMLILKLRCGAAVLGKDFSNLVLPRVTRKICIAVDNDESGRAAASHSVERLRARGLSVRMMMPEKEGDDFNDVLVRGSV
jgi:hypothetical protein